MLKTRTLIFTLIILLAAYLGWQRLFRDDLNLPKGENIQTETIVIEDGEVIDTKDDDTGPDNATSDTEPEIIPNSEKTTNIKNKEEALTTKKITVTDGIKHSVPLDEIKGGGPKKDGIPSIDEPKFTSIEEAEIWLEDSNPGISVSIGSSSRFYPYRILVWHEIVNDTVNGQRILVTYCPLCFSGVVYDPLVGGERVEFGTSGKLWKSNLVMYDRKTDSLWSQVLGEAIVGEMTTTKLKILPSDMVRFGEWKKTNLDGEVLSKDIKVFPPRDYNRDPYGDYYTTPRLLFNQTELFGGSEAEDKRLERKDLILGIIIDGKAKAYLTYAVKEKEEIEDTFAGKTIIAKYESNIDAVRLFEKINSGTLERINPVTSFWFAWVAAYPQTELYK